MKSVIVCEKEKQTRLLDLKAGDIFEHNGFIYVKLKPDKGALRIANIIDGNVFYAKENCCVTQITSIHLYGGDKPTEIPQSFKGEEDDV